METALGGLLYCGHLLHGCGCTRNGVRRSAFLLALLSLIVVYSESVVNGAQVFYYDRFGINGNSNTDVLIQGLVNSAPYLCCAV